MNMNRRIIKENTLVDFDYGSFSATIEVLWYLENDSDFVGNTLPSDHIVVERAIIKKIHSDPIIYFENFAVDVFDGDNILDESDLFYDIVVELVEKETRH